MLNCVYHPTDPMRVVDDDEKDRLLNTGYWFDHPTKAKEMRESYEKKLRSEKHRVKKPKTDASET